MAVSALTIDCRAVANRMAKWPNISGNAAILRGMTYEDSAKVEELRVLIQDEPTIPPGMVNDLVTVHRNTSNVMELGGNVGLFPYMISNSALLVAACDFADSLP